jgi:hypothetical protein
VRLWDVATAMPSGLLYPDKLNGRMALAPGCRRSKVWSRRPGVTGPSIVVGITYLSETPP